jgi:peptidoglycan/LPS O-acetylase OafA/YrhL
LPAYWVILFVCAIVLGSVDYRTAAHELVIGRVVDPQLLARTALLLQDYDPNTLLSGIGPAWSLAVEVVFYLTLPLLAALGMALAANRPSRRSRRWAALAPAALMLLTGITGKAVARFAVPPTAPYEGWVSNWHSVLERSMLMQADLFAFGMALAVIHIDFEDGLLRLSQWWRRAIVAACGTAVLVIGVFGDGALSYSPENTLAAAACTGLLALVVLPTVDGQPSRLVHVLESRPLVAVGVISYSVFLWHVPLIRWLERHGLTVDGRRGMLFNLIVIGIITAVASMLTYRFVEAPALRFGRRPRDTVTTATANVQAAP